MNVSEHHSSSNCARASEAVLAPLVTSCVMAGFPSPADDYIDHPLDLNTHLIQHPSATFFVRVQGSSMVGAGIYDGDLLIVDRALKPTIGKVVVAIMDGEFTVKRMMKNGSKLYLVAENSDFKPIEIKDGTEFQVWGVVTYCLHQVQ
ncbi:translesion error-prone DNA polymerase V autoproteolytic subunit [bacterium]|nr:translesion error-prone DNA polymerase V autoproteolytic subunit [bacterium]